MIPPSLAFRGVSKVGQLIVQRRVSISSLVTYLAKDRMCYPTSSTLLLHVSHSDYCWQRRSKLWKQKCFWLVDLPAQNIMFLLNINKFGTFQRKDRFPVKHRRFGIRIYYWCFYTCGVKVSVRKDRTWMILDLITHATAKHLTKVEGHLHKLDTDNFFSSPRLFYDLIKLLRNSTP